MFVSRRYSEKLNMNAIKPPTVIIMTVTAMSALEFHANTVSEVKKDKPKN